MTKKQKIVLNYVLIFISLFSYFVLKTNNDTPYLQIIQKVFFSVLLLCGIVIVLNNFALLKQVSKKYIIILLLCFGIILTIYSGLILYLILALQNTGF
jgi:hypothetical protein